jgi:hypothetical protein
VIALLLYAPVPLVIGVCIAHPSLELFLAEAAITCILVPLIVLTSRVALLAPTLYAAVLVSPKRLRGWSTIDLADVEGVGMRYGRIGRATGWSLMVWVQQETRPLVIIATVSIRPPGARLTSGIHLIGYVPKLDYVVLADSAPGKAAAAIAAQVATVQGSTGVLAQRAREINAPALDGTETAYWSPNGRTGPIARH